MPFADLAVQEAAFDYTVILDRVNLKLSGTTSSIIHACPYVSELALVNSGSKHGTARGRPRISGEAYKHSSFELVVLEHSLYVKMFLTLRLPPQWRGGVLCELYKGKGSSSLITSYCDIVLSDSSAKTLGAIVRKALLPAARVFSLETQFGSGLNGGETANTHLCVRNLHHVAHAFNRSLSLLLLDISFAFATMVRLLVFSVEVGDEVWLKQLANIGVSVEDIADIHRELTVLVLDDSANVYHNAIATQLHTYVELL